MPAPVKRPIRIEGEIAIVPLTMGLEAIIDAADAPLAAGVNWSAYRAKNGYYAATSIRKRGAKGKTIFLHHTIMQREGDLVVDHKNGSTLDCRRANLRHATRGQNNSNSRVQKRNKSGLKGVTPRRNAWRAQITVDGRTRSLGTYPTPEEAHAVYAEHAIRHFGEFAKLG